MTDHGDPAALLRRAADELERLAALAPAGRWSARGLLATRPEIVAEDDAGATEHVAEARARTAPWILAMSPEVAPALVAWLREAAGRPELRTPAAAEVAAAVLRRP